MPKPLEIIAKINALSARTDEHSEIFFAFFGDVFCVKSEQTFR
jgi:hypothetical protein